MCRPVHHIGDEGKHLEELEEGTSHHEKHLPLDMVLGRRAPAIGYGSGEESACHWIRFWGGERLPLD